MAKKKTKKKSKKPVKKYKPLTKEQAGVLTNKKKLEEQQMLGYKVELNKITFDLKNSISLHFVASIRISQKNISEIDKLIEQGFEVTQQQTSDTVSDQHDARERLKKKKLPNAVKIKPPGMK